MPTATLSVRIGKSEHSTLAEMAKEEGRSMQAVLSEALEEYRRQKFWDKTNAAFQALRDDPEAWQAEVAERDLWDGTLADGLENE